jgi:hypothetical protein
VVILWLRGAESYEGSEVDSQKAFILKQGADGCSITLAHPARHREQAEKI